MVARKGGHTKPVWRKWQTRQLQELVSERTSRFDPEDGHGGREQGGPSPGITANAPDRAGACQGDVKTNTRRRVASTTRPGYGPQLVPAQPRRQAPGVSPVWRNWQTRQLEVLVSERTSRFKPGDGHAIQKGELSGRSRRTIANRLGLVKRPAGFESRTLR